MSRFHPSRLSLVIGAFAIVTTVLWATRTATATPSSAAAPTLPFKIEVVEVPQSRLPAVHSFSSASANGKVLILGGRISGLHGFGNADTNFKRSAANTKAYVLDLVANKVIDSVDLVKSLPAALAGPLTATNPEFVQVADSLYIVGGYGMDLDSTKMITFGTVVRVDVPGLMKAISAKAPLAKYFKQGPKQDNRLKVTGGVMKQNNGTFYLVFGQDFTGVYSIENKDYNHAGGQFQKYTQKVRVFTLGADLSIASFSQTDGGYDANLPYNRRDLNVVDIMQADGKTPAATVYGGVFRAGQVAGHTTAIDIKYASSPKPADTTVVTNRANFQQGLNHYDCANVTVFDKVSGNSFTTLIGGISQFHYDAKTKTLVRDQLDLSRGVDGLPFINSVSTIAHVSGSITQFIQPTALPALLGSEAHFLVSPTLKGTPAVFANGVINLAALKGRTRIGSVYGGIESKGPYSTLVKTSPATSASKRLFAVYVTPGATPVVAMPPLPTSTTPYP